MEEEYRGLGRKKRGKGFSRSLFRYQVKKQ